MPVDASRAHRITLALIVFVYAGLSCTSLRLPGLQYDEVLFAGPALGIGDAAAYGWQVGHIEVPVMIMAYIGALKAWLFAPLFALFGTGPVVVRLPMVALGAVVILSVYGAARLMFDARVALVASALLGVDPSFLLGVRNDYGPVALMLATKTASLYLLARFATEERRWELLVGFLLLGLGLFDKFNFAWHIAAAGVGALVAWPNSRRFVTLRNAGAAVLGMAAGCWPLLVYNVISHGGTLAHVEPEPSLADAFAMRMQVIRLTLEGKAFPLHELGSVPDSGTLLLWALALSIPAGVLARHHMRFRSFAFCWVVMVAVIIAIIVTPKAAGPHHAMMLWPFPQLVVSAACIGVLDLGRVWMGGRFRAAGFLGAAVAGAVALTSLSLDAHTLAAFRSSGGRGNWSAAIYDLSEVVSSDHGHRYLLMDWGLSNQLLLLSRGAAHDEEVFRSFLDAGRESDLADDLHRRAVDPRTLFVFRAPGRANFPEPRNVFELMLERHHMREVILRRFRELDGPEVFYIARAIPMDGSAPSPEDLPRKIARAEHGWLRAEQLEPGCNGGLAIFAVTWGAPGSRQTEVHVEAPNGTLFAGGSDTGSAITGPWVRPGLMFYLQDVTNAKALTPENTIAKLQVEVDCQ